MMSSTLPCLLIVTLTAGAPRLERESHVWSVMQGASTIHTMDYGELPKLLSEGKLPNALWNSALIGMQESSHDLAQRRTDGYIQDVMARKKKMQNWDFIAMFAAAATMLICARLFYSVYKSKKSKSRDFLQLLVLIAVVLQLTILFAMLARWSEF